MMELRERIARAIFKSFFEDEPGYEWETACKDDRDDSEELAQAVIEELGIVEDQQTIARIRAALSSHPRACDAHTEDDPITCGWKQAVLDVQKALDGE
jgi:hypothetical protein